MNQTNQTHTQAFPQASLSDTLDKAQDQAARKKRSRTNKNKTKPLAARFLEKVSRKQSKGTSKSYPLHELQTQYWAYTKAYNERQRQREAQAKQVNNYVTPQQASREVAVT